MTGAPSSSSIRHAGSIAPGVIVCFRYNPTTGELSSSLSGDPRRHPREDVLRRYRAVRHEFFERVAAVLGYSVGVLEVDEDGNADRVHVVKAPQARHA